MTEQEILNIIYPSVVTVRGDWQKMLEEVAELGLDKISLFLTGAEALERKKIYKSLDKFTSLRIPHVHLRNDRQDTITGEIEMLIRKYRTQVFTVHYEYIDLYDRCPYKKRIFIENSFGYNLDVNEIKLEKIKKFGGFCIDCAHDEQYRIHFPKFYELIKAGLSHIAVGCNHISAVMPDGWSNHQAEEKSEFNYLAKMPKNYFSNYLNIELGNPISEQLEYKKYIAKILVKAWKK